MNLEKNIADTFAASRPSDAARVLETLGENDLRELLDDSDFRAAATVVEALTPLEASRCLCLVSVSRAADILNELPLGRAADLLRRVDGDTREAILSNVPEPRQRPLQKLLSFPEQTAGAMMEPRVESFPQGMTVEATLRKIRQPGRHLRYYLYVLDDDHVLIGVTSLRELASASVHKTLRSIMARPVHSLSARAGKNAILEHPGWRRFPVLPVVDEASRLIGVFRYETFRRLQGLPDLEEASPLKVALAVGELFWLGASGLLRGLEERPPSTRLEEA
ncbi:MAG TPA: CBS domain-containing protein [Vicinamibacteria bacterium]|nr:CBS domain-containing protein [Vicinamibacteria bacterium]